MSKVVRFTAPPSIPLHKLSEEEIRRTVADEAAKALDKLPKEIRPSGVGAVALASINRGGGGAGGDWGVWAEWTRACADQAPRIDDYVDPVESVINEAAQKLPGTAQFQSGLTIRSLGAVQEKE
jgi:hypothetical protein